ncbi:MAG: membrane protein [Micavibrio sp.]|nr:MAG: membrane protein [Micavibrio sp.]
MRTLFIFAVLFACLPFFSAHAQDRSLTIDLAEDRVDITAGFTGARLALFGVKKGPGQVVVVIRGPEKTMVVRRKESALGIWFNKRGVKFRKVPVYYDYALSVPESELAEPETLKKNGIGLNALKFEPDTWRDKPEYAQSFQEALIRNKQAEGLFPLKPRRITFLDDNFFRASFYVPSNVPTGQYQVQSFLIRDGAIVDVQTTALNVGQVGLEAKIYKFAYEQSLAYGLLCVLIAVMAGWLANAIRIRGG